MVSLNDSIETNNLIIYCLHDNCSFLNNSFNQLHGGHPGSLVMIQASIPELTSQTHGNSEEGLSYKVMS